MVDISRGSKSRKNWLYTGDENTNAQAVGMLIAETYRKFNLDFATPEEQKKLLVNRIGQQLVERCDQESASRGSRNITVAAALFAVLFY
jgi:hypothetical protein